MFVCTATIYSEIARNIVLAPDLAANIKHAFHQTMTMTMSTYSDTMVTALV